jgi:hypothetical protein
MKQMLLILLMVVSGWSATYYVSTSGNDSNDGLSPSAPWQTVAKINSGLSKGDTVRFKCNGDWWNSRIVTPVDSIYYSSYGEGAKPRILAGKDYTTGYAWHASANGTNEYYLTTAANGNPSLTSPTTVWLNDRRIYTGTIGSLLQYQFAYGDNDGLGFNTLYVRDNNGNPQTIGTQIVTNGESNSVYMSAKSYVFFNNLNIRYCSGSGVRVTTSGKRIEFTNCVIENCDDGLYFEYGDSTLVDRCIIRNIHNDYNGAIRYANTASFGQVRFTSLYACDGYGITSSSTGSVAHKIYNCTFYGIRLAVTSWSGSGTTNGDIRNCIAAGCAYSGNNIWLENNNGTVTVNNCSYLPSYNQSLAFFSGAVDGGTNMQKHPLFVKDRFKGYFIVRKDDYVGGSDGTEDFRGYAQVCDKYGYGMSWYMSSLRAVTPRAWDSINVYLPRGHEVGIHSMTHAAINADTAFSIQYTGSGSTCVLTINIDYANRSGSITANSDNDADDFTYNFTGVDTMLGDHDGTRTGLVLTINNLPNYTCQIKDDYNYRAWCYTLKAQTNTDIKAPKQIEFDLENFFNEEVKLAGQMILDSTIYDPSDTLTISYPGGYYDARIIDSLNATSNIKSGSTVTGTSGSFMDSLPIFEISCVGTSTFDGLNDTIRMKGESIAAHLAARGGVLCILGHSLPDYGATKMDSLLSAIHRIQSGCEVRTQKYVTSKVRFGGSSNDNKLWRYFQNDSTDLRLKPTSPCKNKGDKTAITGIPNLYTLDGVQLTDASGTVLVDSINIGAYGTYYEIPDTTPSAPTITSVSPSSPRLFKTFEATGTNLSNCKLYLNSVSLGTPTSATSTTISDTALGTTRGFHWLIAEDTLTGMRCSTSSRIYIKNTQLDTVLLRRP